MWCGETPAVVPCCCCEQLKVIDASYGPPGGWPAFDVTVKVQSMIGPDGLTLGAHVSKDVRVTGLMNREDDCSDTDTAGVSCAGAVW